MSDESPCWENTTHPLPERSPFDQVLILGWYDGPEEGLIRCGKCKRVYLFKSLDFVNEDEGLRLFGLAPLPADSIDRAVQALFQYMSQSGQCGRPSRNSRRRTKPLRGGKDPGLVHKP